MVKKVYEESKIAAIAEKIRSKTGGTETYTTAQMPSGVDTVYAKGETEGYSNGYSVGETEGYTQGYAEGDSAGYERGYPEGYAKGETDGYNEGHTQGYTEGETAGKQAEYDAFWDRMQEYGNRTKYDMAFCVSRFPLPEFKPKYNMNVTNASYMFTYWSNTPDMDWYFELDLRNCGVEIDFSQSTTFQSVFQTNYQVTAVGVFDTRSATTLTQTFYYAINLHTIEKLILKDDGSQKLTNTFTNCSALQNITVEGVIGFGGTSFKWSSKLSKASITSIINALSSTTSGLTVTLSKTAVNKAFATTEGGTDGSTSDEWAALIATKTNWTITLS